MRTIGTLALALCAIIISISAVESTTIDLRPEAVEKWLKKLDHKKEKVTKLHFFFHETASGNNQTTYLVAQSNISLTTSPSFFGLVSMIDDILREGAAPDSPIVGRAQGLLGSCDLDEITLFMSMNFVFTTGKYNGSTLTVLGRNPTSNKYREMAIVGGTGFFRLARGFVTTNTIMLNTTTFDVIAEYKVVVFHY